MNDAWMNVVRDTITVMLFALFVALILDTWRPRRRKELDSVADLVFDAEDRRDGAARDEAPP